MERRWFVRPIEADDLTVWCRMRHALWPDVSLDQLQRECEAQIEDPSFHLWLAQTENGDAIAFAEIAVRPYANGCDTGPVPFLEGIWVDPSWLRQGVGRALIGEVESWARANGYREIGSDALLDNHRSHDAHKAWGFVERQRVAYFRKMLG